ncbi:MAG: hypothetical protein UW22_C0069G0007 [Candidatus Gottesmanbacteria bacterium GW2011_GWB1_44_11c]|uniref:Uncharacterized protein n=1 Tax=Candidatus Gottesmanbacteria bacterium GW2011_GWB1_44_11c TaxID=1618447 RepID=A0A0G1GJW0_9BACT|nr:MAG: hypothetical protein UW22_C0069G0007 [Candidatus Gottesmanbacteria bacterium GW2011_GWB1_44_11c]
MKYPSVFLAIAVTWVVVDVLAIVFRQADISFGLYISRNK